LKPDILGGKVGNIDTGSVEIVDDAPSKKACRKLIMTQIIIYEKEYFIERFFSFNEPRCSISV